jgi:hypothetical protein
MVILLAAVTMIFAGTTNTVAIQEARMTVFTNARYALDKMEADLLGMLSFDPITGQRPQQVGTPAPIQPPFGAQVGQQRFWMENGYAGTPGQLPQKMSGHHTDQAGDSMGFRASTSVGNSMQTVEVTYSLIPADHAIGPGNTLQAGDSTHAKTVGTGRALFTLVRKLRSPVDMSVQGAAPQAPPSPNLPWNFNCKVMDPSTGTLTDLIDEELCHYVISFNLEYYAQNEMFSQLEPSPFPQSQPAGQEPPFSPTLYRCPAVRVTLVVVDDAGERQERTIQKVIWVPEG